MTPETKRSLWSYLRGLLIGFLVGFGVNTSYWSHRVHDIAKTEEAVRGGAISAFHELATAAHCPGKS